MPAEPTRRAIVVGPKAHELRRFVGAISWAVLEEMMQAATGPTDRLVAEVSIRSLAASLGVAKDTVARAVRRLRDLDVIEADQRRAESGVFQTGVYRPAVPTTCLTIAPTTTPAEPTRPPHLASAGPVAWFVLAPLGLRVVVGCTDTDRGSPAEHATSSM